MARDLVNMAIGLFLGGFLTAVFVAGRNRSHS